MLYTKLDNALWSKLLNKWNFESSEFCDILKSRKMLLVLLRLFRRYNPFECKVLRRNSPKALVLLHTECEVLHLEDVVMLVKHPVFVRLTPLSSDWIRQISYRGLNKLRWKMVYHLMRSFSLTDTATYKYPYIDPRPGVTKSKYQECIWRYTCYLGRII